MIVKRRLFKIMRPGLAKEMVLCDQLGRAKVNQKKGESVDTCEEIKAHGREFSFYPILSRLWPS